MPNQKNSKLAAITDFVPPRLFAAMSCTMNFHGIYRIIGDGMTKK